MWSWCRDMAKQADLQELAQTAFVAAIFAFMLSKLVSIVLAIRGGNLRLERVSEAGEGAVEAENSGASSDSHESAHSSDSDGDRADVSGLSEGRADVSEVSESGGIEDTGERGPRPAFPAAEAASLLKKRGIVEQEGIVGRQSLAPADVDLREAGYEQSGEPSTTTESEAEGSNRLGFKTIEVPENEDDDSSDWEGVESTELDEAFGAASSYVATVAGGGLKVPNDVQLQLYGLYKIATEGPCNTPQPSALKMTARAKWNAWQKLGNISPEEAMERYVAIVSEFSPEWTQAIQKSSKGGEGTSDRPVGSAPNQGRMGPVFSTLADEEKASEEGTLEPLHVAAREGNESSLLGLINQGCHVDVRDSDGRTPLHWASDRGHVKIVEILLAKGAEIQAKDKEGQTALHYATICEQEMVAKHLLEKGADPEAKDVDGATPMSFCPARWNWMGTSAP